MRHVIAAPRSLPLIAVLLAAGCGQAALSTPTEPAGQQVAVTVTPGTVTVPAGAAQAFVADVTGTANTAVTWSVVGAACGSITAAGAYAAPGAAATCQVKAVSQADPTKSGVAAITVTAPPPPVTVTISPPSVALDACGTQTFTATVTGAANTAVTWKVLEAASGAVSAGGVYTAPDGNGTLHVVATSVADPTRSASAPVTVSTKVLSVAVDPPTLALPTSGTAQLRATVTTTCGSVTSLKTIGPGGRAAN